MGYKSFDNERDAKIYRNAQRDQGLAASLFTYAKDKHIVQVEEPTPPFRELQSFKERLSRTQGWLSLKAYTVTKDIEELTKVKELINDPDFGCEIGDAVFVAKKLENDRFFSSPKSVVDFFDCPGDFIEKIKELVDEGLEEYEGEWKDYSKLAKGQAHSRNVK